jgi:hypothetical protein
MSRLVFCQKAYLGILVLRSLEPLTINQLNQVPLLVASLSAHDSVGGERQHDEVERHQNSQDLPDRDCG